MCCGLGYSRGKGEVTQKCGFFFYLLIRCRGISGLDEKMRRAKAPLGARKKYRNCRYKELGNEWGASESKNITSNEVERERIEFSGGK